MKDVLYNKVKEEDKKWIKFYNCLKKHYDEYKTIEDIHMEYVTEDGIELGFWLYKQKRLFNANKLSAEKSRLLENFDIEWDYLKPTVDRLYKTIEDYYNQNKSLNNMPKDIRFDYDRLKSILNNNIRFCKIKSRLEILEKGELCNA